LTDVRKAGAAARRSQWPLLAAALLVWPLGLGGLALLRRAPDAVERFYSAWAYQLIAGAQRGVAALFPVSLSELLLVGLSLWVAGSSWSGARRWRAGTVDLRSLAAAALRRFVLAAGALWLFFLAAWGVQHARMPYAWHAGLDLQPVSTEELREVSAYLIEEANRLRPLVADEELSLREGPRGVDPRLARAFERRGRSVPALAGGGLLLRSALLSPLLARLGISGIYSPFTGEAHVNDEVVPWVLLFSASHELAHQKGFAREDEANLVAWQVCRGSGEPALEYSATLIGLRFAVNALAVEDEAAALELIAQLGEGPREDLEANRRFWAEHHSALTEVAVSVNDTYLRSTGSAEGVRSYGRMLDGLVAEWREREAVPVAPR
jgi:hypothetical protein